MADSECILFVQNDSDSRVKVFIYYKSDTINALQKKLISIEPYEDGLTKRKPHINTKWKLAL